MTYRQWKLNQAGRRTGKWNVGSSALDTVVYIYMYEPIGPNRVLNMIKFNEKMGLLLASSRRPEMWLFYLHGGIDAERRP